MISLISFLIVIGICVISHEGGHFWAARFRNVMIHEFAFGMGPEILRRKKGETQFSVRAFPIGGFVRLEGEDANSADEPNEGSCDPSRSLVNKKPWERILIMAAGASVNIALAWLLTAIYLAGYGAYNMSEPKLGNILENTPAYEIGLQSGDIIKSIDGNQLKSWGDIQRYVRAADKQTDSFDIVIERSGEEMSFVAEIPETEGKGRLLGVQPAHEKFPASKAFSASLSYTWNMSLMILKGIWLTVTGQVKADVTGPVGIAVMAGDAVQSGLWTFVAFLGIINLNLGLLNLLPFPALDGGRIVFVLIEMITRRRVPERIETMVHYAGFVVLIALIVLVTGKDIFRLFISDM